MSQTPLRTGGTMTTPEKNRHRRPWADNSRTTYVELLTPDTRGQIFEGRFRIPARLAKTQAHTNERHELDGIVRDAVNRWRIYRERNGWEMTTKPLLSEPYVPHMTPMQRAQQIIDRAQQMVGTSGKAAFNTTVDDDGSDLLHVQMWARFKRTIPLYLKLEDMLYMRDKAKIFGVDLEKDFMPVTASNQHILPGGDSGWVNPLLEAEQSRRRLGIRRQDYLIGKLEDPL